MGTFLRRNIFVGIFLLFVSVLPATGGTWARTTIAWEYDSSWSVDLASDGGFVLAGAQADREMVLKLSASGNVQWQKGYDEVYAGSGASVIRSLPDSNLIVAGSFYLDMRLLKLTSQGDVIWDKKYQRTQNSSGNFVLPTKDGGYLLLGFTLPGGGYPDLCLLKLDNAGSIQWERTIRSAIGAHIIQTNDGGYFLTGVSFMVDDGDLLLLKMDPSGNIQWKKIIGKDSIESGKSAFQAANGDYVVAGSIQVSKTPLNSDTWLLRFSPNGMLQWQEILGGAGVDGADNILPFKDGFILVGETYSFGFGKSDVWVLFLDGQGNLRWQKTYGGDSWDGAYAAVNTNDGGFVLVGYTSSLPSSPDNTWTLKLDALGNVNGGCPEISTNTNVRPNRMKVAAEKNLQIQFVNAETTVSDNQTTLSNIASNQAYQCSPIRQLIPRSIIPGRHLVVDGSGFGSSQAGSKIQLGKLDLGVAEFWSDNRIQVRIPEIARTAPLILQLAGKQTNPIELIVTPPSSQPLWPSDGPASGLTRVVAKKPYGMFSSVQVLFGNKPAANVHFFSARDIVCTTPPGSGIVSVTITDGQSTTVLGTFTYR